MFAISTAPGRYQTQQALVVWFHQPPHVRSQSQYGTGDLGPGFKAATLQRNKGPWIDSTILSKTSCQLFQAKNR